MSRALPLHGLAAGLRFRGCLGNTNNSLGGYMMLGIIDQIEHLWKDHKKVVIGAAIVLVIAIII